MMTESTFLGKLNIPLMCRLKSVLLSGRVTQIKHNLKAFLLNVLCSFLYIFTLYSFTNNLLEYFHN